MPYSEIDMDDGPYASLIEEDPSLNAGKQKWSNKQKAIGAAVVLLVLVVTVGVVVGICTRGNNDVTTSSTSPVHIATKTTVSRRTTTTPKTTTTTSRTTTSLTTTVPPSTTVVPKTTVTQSTTETTIVTNPTTTVPSTTPTTTVASTTAITSKAPVPKSSCEAGSSPVFLLQHNATVGTELRSQHAESLAECTAHCAVSEDCSVFEFFNKTCAIFEKRSRTYSTDPAAKVLTKTCVKSDRVCSAPFHFSVHKQTTLHGFVREVLAADKMEECLAACLNAHDNYGFVCKSAQFYPIDHECILNTESHLDQLDNWYAEDEETVILLDNNCARPDHTEDGVIIPTEDPTTCPPSFVRSRQMILVGYASYVAENTPTVTKCLEMCNNPPSASVENVECISVMYYYEEQECIINSKNREEHPDMFIAEGDGFKVDYFDVSRHLQNQTCPEGTMLRSMEALEEDQGVETTATEKTKTSGCVCM